jgi:hypothetical protein
VVGAGGRGDRGDFGVVLTLEGENGTVAVGGMQRRLAAASRGGGALVHFRPWEGAEDAQLDGLDLLVVLARLEGQRQRQNVGGGGELDNGRRRRGSVQVRRRSGAGEDGRGRGLGFPGRSARGSASPFMGTHAGTPCSGRRRRRPGRGLPWPMGFSGPGWAGAERVRVGAGRVHGLGPGRKG